MATLEPIGVEAGAPAFLFLFLFPLQLAASSEKLEARSLKLEPNSKLNGRT